MPLARLDRFRLPVLIALGGATLLGCALDSTALGEGSAASSAMAAAAPDGEALYELACATCHFNGGGMLGGPRTPDLLRDELAIATGPRKMAAVVRNGIAPPRMPSFENGLDPAEIDAIVAYVFAQRAVHAGGR